MKTTKYYFIRTLNLAFLSMSILFITACNGAGGNGIAQPSAQAAMKQTPTAQAVGNIKQALSANATATEGTGVSIASDGSIYAIGYTNGVFPKSEQAQDNYYINKYSSSGSLLWSRQNGGKYGLMFGNGINTDKNGNSYIVGYSALGNSTSYGYFVTKYSNNGDQLWMRLAGVVNNDTEGNGISTDADGNVYICGYTTVGISGQHQNGRNDYFIVKYSTDGQLLWARQVGATNGSTGCSAITVDSEGDSYIVGSTNVGISGQTQNGTYDYFIAKYSENGSILWTKQVGAESGEADARGISADGKGNIYITGFTNIEESGQIEKSGNSYFIAKYTTDGTTIWSKQVGVEGEFVYGYSVSNDLNGNVYITGTTSTGLSGQTQNGFYDYFIAKYSESGSLIWSRQDGGYHGTANGYGVGIDQQGNAYVDGTTSVALSGQQQKGYFDYFVVKYSPTASPQWASQGGSI